MQNPPPVQTTKSSTGLDENIAALLSYIFGWVSGLIFFLIEKDSRLVRFHAMQSILLNVAAIVIGIVLWIVWGVLAIVVGQISGALASLISILLGLLIFVFYIAALLAVILCLVKAYQKQYFKLPVIGNFAEKFSAK
ncbi:MAG TPA: DUF4870 domain-containing protein [Pyrinomonadaceae bacterium]|nr:DUF4870 domain-containing protein [Pyrinomonadaceae bacterium]